MIRMATNCDISVTSVHWAITMLLSKYGSPGEGQDKFILLCSDRDYVSAQRAVAAPELRSYPISAVVLPPEACQINFWMLARSGRECVWVNTP